MRNDMMNTMGGSGWGMTLDGVLVLSPHRSGDRSQSTALTNRERAGSVGSRPMIKHTIATTLLSSALLGFLSTAPYAHEKHSVFSAGEPGDPNRPARTIKVAMQEAEKKMMFDPTVITVRKGEQIRFVLYNEGTESHEFVLATAAENRKHAQRMKKFPHMMHDDPNAKRLGVFNEGQLLWSFTKVGEFEFACLIPGHYEAGMHGKLIVLP